jgi:aspartate-semialdehyde dehydrogenase
MMMGMAGLFQHDLVEWLTSMTYQAASGAGAANMRELAEQMAHLGDVAKPMLSDPGATALDIERRVSEAVRNGGMPKEHFGQALAGSLLPWIDKDLGDGQSREEWKGQAETNKILGRSERPIPVDGICVRVGAMRCHSQALTIKLRKDVPLDELQGIVAEGNEWVRVVPNRNEESLAELTPAAVTGRLTVPVGRCASCRWAASTCRPSRWATSCSGERRSPCAGCCAFCWTPGSGLEQWVRRGAEPKTLCGLGRKPGKPRKCLSLQA